MSDTASSLLGSSESNTDGYNSSDGYDSSEDSTDTSTVSSETISDVISEPDETFSDRESSERTMDGSEKASEMSVNPSFLQPLFEGSEVSVLESYLMLLQYSLRHSLTKKPFSELLDLVIAHLPNTSKCATSIYKLKQFFIEMFSNVTGMPHKFCAKCHQLLDNVESCTNGCSALINEFPPCPTCTTVEKTA